MTFTWTPKTVERCSELYAQGQHSAAQIGDIIGTTKMAVIGKMNRTGIASGHQREYPPPKPRALKPAKPNEKLKALYKAGCEMRAKPAEKPVEPVAALPAPVAPPVPAIHVLPGLKTITELSAHECRYPVREIAGIHRFCAKPTARGESYCPACRALVYTDVKPRIGQNPTAGRRFA